MKPSATIIGGSMAGLFAATALLKNGWEISIHEKVPVPLSGRGAGIATYDELADLVFKATNNNDVLGTTAKLRVSLDNDGNINEIGRAHVRTPVTEKSRMPSSA